MLNNSRGVSLAELMVAMAILTTAVLAGMSSFSYISTSIRKSRTKTIAANIAQEKMEVLKNMSYYRLIVTTDPYSNTDFTPNISYDKFTYSSETIRLWGVPAFTRAVRVDYVDYGAASLVTLPSSSNDSGIKAVTVYVFWLDGVDWKKVEIQNLFANPDASTLDAGIIGKVTISGGGNLAGALVEVATNNNWKGNSNASGDYSFQVANGTYSVVCSSAGYYSQTAYGINAYRGFYATQNFTMVKIASGSILGQVWVSPNILISQVAASTGTQGGGEVEYVELYNPTTYAWTMDASHLEVVYKKNNGSASTTLSLTFNTATLPAQSFYLIGSTSPITINGSSRTADAQYAVQANVIEDGEDGGIGIRLNSSSDWYDRVAWSKNPGPLPPVDLTEGTAYDIPNPPYTGLPDNAVLIRLTSTGTANTAYGNAYDTNRNIYNFTLVSPIVVAPRNAAVSLPAISGKPAHGALAVSNDGLSIPTQAAAVNYGSTSEYAQMTLTNVTTGTWTVTITSGSVKLAVSNVSLSATGSVAYIPDGATSPSWPVAGYNASVLTSTSSGGYVHGYVYGADAAFWSPISNILVEANGQQTRTAANGYYLINVDAGAVTVNANFALANANYVTASEAGSVTEGQLSFIASYPYFHLSQGGTLRGYVTSGSGALPNIVVKAQQGSTIVEGTTDQTGYFHIQVTTSATPYTITPVLDPMETYTTNPSPLAPSSVTVAGSTVFCGTITLTSSVSTIRGRVTDGGQLITTGVLIVASTGTIADPPLRIYGSTAAAMSRVYYAGSSAADGTYSLEVRKGTYTMRGFYPVMNLNTGTVTYSYKELASFNLEGGTIISDKDFSWP